MMNTRMNDPILMHEYECQKWSIVVRLTTIDHRIFLPLYYMYLYLCISVYHIAYGFLV